MRKFIPTLLLISSIPAFVVAGPYGHNLGAHANQGAKNHMGGSGMSCEQRSNNYGFHNDKNNNHDMGGMNNITPEQRQKMREVMRKQAQKRWDIEEQYYNKLPETDRKAMELELEKVREETRKEMRSMLTSEQQKAFDNTQKIKEERIKEWQEFQQWKASKTSK